VGEPGRGGERFAEFDVRLIRTDQPDAATNEQASAQLRITVKELRPRRGGTALLQRGHRDGPGQLPGLLSDLTPGEATAYGVYWPALVARHLVSTRWSSTHDGRRVPDRSATDGAGTAGTRRPTAQPTVDTGGHRHRGPEGVRGDPGGGTRRLPLGTVIGARSGDKGGNANVGLWARPTPAWEWLDGYSPSSASGPCCPKRTTSRSTATSSRTCGPSTSWWWAAGRGRGLLHPARSQAKSLGEYLRSARSTFPGSVLAGAPGSPSPPTEEGGEYHGLRESDELQMLREAVDGHRLQVRPQYYVRRPAPTSAPTSCGTRWPQPAFLGVNVPEEYGGGGMGDHRAGRGARGVGASTGCPLLVIVVSPAICATIIAKFGSEEQKQRWLPGFATGELKMAFAITEPDAGSNSHNLALTATKDGDIYRLNGSKYYISGRRVPGHPGGDPVGVDETAAAGGCRSSSWTPTLPGLDKTGAAGRDRGPGEAVHPVLRQRRGRGRPAARHRGRRAAPGVLGLNPERILSAATANGIGRYALDKASEYARDR
jgi:hypothetical protein